MKLGLLPGFLSVHVLLAGLEKLCVKASHTLVQIISRNLSCGCDLCYHTETPRWSVLSPDPEPMRSHQT